MKDYFDKLILQIKYTIEIYTCKSDNCIQSNIDCINNALNNSILYDYLNSKINLNQNNFNLADSLDEQLYKNVINYLHKDNIYLYYDVEITHNTNEFPRSHPSRWECIQELNLPTNIGLSHQSLPK